MKKLIAIIIFIALIAGFSYSGVTPAEKDPLDITLKTLYQEASTKSKIVFDIPVEVKILDVTPDLDWYKVKISFKLGPFQQTHVGWAKIPFDELLLAVE